MTKNKFILKSDYNPKGDQPDAIKKLADGIKNGKAHQILQGVTGSGKTFTMANIIQEVQKPTLVPVSYTHLDVYKRQPLSCLFKMERGCKK